MPTTISGSTGVTYPAGGLDNIAGAGVGTTDTQTLTNKTLTSPAVNSPTIGGTPVMGASVITSGTAVATTSGTSIDFTGIPSWVKRITVMFNGVSTNGTSLIQVQIGDSGGVETTSYSSSAWTVNTNNSGSTTGFIIHGANGAASRVWDGAYTIVLQDTSSTWVFTGMCHSLNDTSSSIGIGKKQLSPGPLDRVRITTVNGTDTFDAGSINILYE